MTLFWIIVFIVGIISTIVFGVQVSKTQAVPTGEAISGVYVIKDWYMNSYLVSVGDGKYIAIDAGQGPNGVRNGLMDLDIPKGDIIAVFLTQSKHHRVGLGQSKGAPVYAGTGSADRKVTDKMSDGETVEVGGVTIECIFTSGHSVDSVSYLIDGKYLFAGDAISLRDGNVDLFNKVYNKSNKDLEKDIQKLAALTGLEYVFTAHYGFTDSPVYP
jgi:glyoxylase-like metal-dependent hydrolase (beta-lactamase superfamily II)